MCERASLELLHNRHVGGNNDDLDNIELFFRFLPKDVFTSKSASCSSYSLN